MDEAGLLRHLQSMVRAILLRCENTTGRNTFARNKEELNA
jgi:hypothetical protein